MANPMLENFHPSRIRIIFSVALCLGKSIDNPVYQFKSQLSKVLGKRDKSLNAEPHVTFNTFVADERELKRAISYLTSFSSQIEPFVIHLNRFDVFEESGVIYLALDEKSFDHVSRLMKLLHKEWDKKAEKQYNPHVTIARNLSPQELKIAKDLFLHQSVDIHLECEHLSLQRRDWNEFHYSITSNFKFKGLMGKSLFS